MGMNWKAALLSALVLPGLGQIFKGERVKGGVIIFLVNLFLLGALAFILKGAGAILANQTAGSAALFKALSDLQHNTPGARWLLAAFSVLWAFSVVDALRGGGRGE